MKDYEKVPWPKVHEYLLYVISCHTMSEFIRAASAEVQTLIPFDAACGISATSDARSLGGSGMGEHMCALYDQYYITKNPCLLNGDTKRLDWNFLLSAKVMDWRKHTNLEFATDFMLANGICKSLTHVLSDQRITLAIHRSRLSPDFSDAEGDTLGVIDEYLNALLPHFEHGRESTDPACSTQGIKDRFGSLSRREAEVSSLVARRFNTSEIAACLFISRRTVERHLDNIFDKMDVRSREQLRRRLGVTSPGQRLSADKP